MPLKIKNFKQELSITRHYHIEFDTNSDELACQIERLVRKFQDHEVKIAIDFKDDTCDSCGYQTDNTTKLKAHDIVDHGKIVALYKAGWPDTKIAQECCVARATVYRHLVAEGLIKTKAKHLTKGEDYEDAGCL